MHRVSDAGPLRIDAFFATPAAREDRWRELVEMATAWRARKITRDAFEAALQAAEVSEEFHGFPGAQLMLALRNRAKSDDAAGPGARLAHIVCPVNPVIPSACRGLGSARGKIGRGT